MVYVDGYVIPVKNDRLEEYTEISEKSAQIWMKHGALQYIECVGDDLSPDMGEEVGRFDKLTNAAADETVMFSFIIYSSREHRDEVNAKVMADPGMEEMPKQMPFEVKRMNFGGFKSIVEY